MKRLSLLFLIILALGTCSSFFQSCDDTKTYAEMLEDEKNAISKFVSKHHIKTISKEQFEKDTVTNYAANEYVQFSNGVYLQIIKRGEGDTIKNRDEIVIRMKEYNIMAEINDEVYADTISNVDSDDLVDSFYYNANSNTYFVYNQYNGYFPYFYAANNLVNQTLDVPQGIISVLPYLKHGAHIKLIVPSKLGHSYAMQYVYPFYYEITKLTIK